MKMNDLNLKKLLIIFLIGLLQWSCTTPVEIPEKLISDRTALAMDGYLSNRTPEEIPDDDRITFGYTFEEVDTYLTYLKYVAGEIQMELDSVTFVIAAYPPNPERGNKVYRAIYLKPIFSTQNINRGDTGTETNSEDEAQEFKTILDMSGCCPPQAFIEAQR